MTEKIKITISEAWRDKQGILYEVANTIKETHPDEAKALQDTALWVSAGAMDPFTQACLSVAGAAIRVMKKNGYPFCDDRPLIGQFDEFLTVVTADKEAVIQKTWDQIAIANDLREKLAEVTGIVDQSKIMPLSD